MLNWNSSDRRHANGFSTSPSGAKPANIVAGNLILVRVQTRFRKEITSVAGNNLTALVSVQESTSAGTRSTIKWYYKIAGSNEPDTYDFTINDDAEGWKVSTFRLTGFNSTSIFGAGTSVVTSGTSSVTSITLPQIATDEDGATLVADMAIRQADDFNANVPSGMTELYKLGQNHASNEWYEHVAIETRATAGNTGTRQWTWATAERAVGTMFSINPGADTLQADGNFKLTGTGALQVGEPVVFGYNFEARTKSAKILNANSYLHFDLSKAPNNFWTDVTSDGGNIRVVHKSSNGQVAREVRSFDKVNKKGSLFFKSDGLSTTEDTGYLIGTVTGATEPAKDSYNGRERVWPSSFKAVYAMDNLTTSTIQDSTSNGNDGTKAAANRPPEVDSVVGKGQDFDKSQSDYINCGNAASLDITGDNLTIGCVVKPKGLVTPGSGTTFYPIIAKGDFQYQIRLESYSNGNIAARGIVHGTTGIGNSVLVSSSPEGVNNNPFLIQLQLINQTIDTKVNNSGTTKLSDATISSNTGVNVNIGRDTDNTERLFSGEISFLYISSDGLSDNWLSTEYNNFMDAEFWNVLEGLSPDDMGIQNTKLFYPHVDFVLNREPSYTGSPFDIIVDVEFTHEDAVTKINSQAFYDGDDKWVIRFTGTKIGTWSFVTASSITELNGIIGSIVVASQDNLNIQGGLITESSQFYIEQQDGSKKLTPYNVLGTGTGTGRIYYPIIFNDYDTTYQPWGTRFLRVGETVSNTTLEDQINDMIADLDAHHMQSALIIVMQSWVKYDSTIIIAGENDTPDIVTFKILERIFIRLAEQGYFAHLWIWGDDGSKKAIPKNLTGGTNGVVDLRVQRHIAARLAPFLNWSGQYGYDAREHYATPAQIKTWYDNMKSYMGWDHMLSMREDIDETIDWPGEITWKLQDKGPVTSATNNTLTDTSKGYWKTGKWVNSKVRIVSGTGAGQERTVSGNTENQLTVSVNWITNPSTDSVYEVGDLLDFTSLGIHDSANGYWGFADYGYYADTVMLHNLGRNQPIHYAERFLYNRHALFTAERTVRMMWEFFFAGNASSILGPCWDGANPGQGDEYPAQTKKEFEIFITTLNFFGASSITRDNSITNGFGFITDDNRMGVYRQNVNSVDIDLTGYSLLSAIAINTRAASYEEFDITSSLNSGQPNTLSFGLTSDWVVVIQTQEMPEGGSFTDVVIDPFGAGEFVVFNAGGSFADVFIEPFGKGQALKAGGSFTDVIIEAFGIGVKPVVQLVTRIPDNLVLNKNEIELKGWESHQWNTHAGWSVMLGATKVTSIDDFLFGTNSLKVSFANQTDSAISTLGSPNMLVGVKGNRILWCPALKLVTGTSSPLMLTLLEYSAADVLLKTHTQEITVSNRWERYLLETDLTENDTTKYIVQIKRVSGNPEVYFDAPLVMKNSLVILSDAFMNNELRKLNRQWVNWDNLNDWTGASAAISEIDPLFGNKCVNLNVTDTTGFRTMNLYNFTQGSQIFIGGWLKYITGDLNFRIGIDGHVPVNAQKTFVDTDKYHFYSTVIEITSTGDYYIKFPFKDTDNMQCKLDAPIILVNRSFKIGEEISNEAVFTGKSAAKDTDNLAVIRLRRGEINYLIHDLWDTADRSATKAGQLVESMIKGYFEEVI